MRKLSDKPCKYCKHQSTHFWRDNSEGTGATDCAECTDGVCYPTLVVLGQDDWLVFARRQDGVLVYTIIEVDPFWLDTPHRGEAEYGSAEWREDNLWMQCHVIARKYLYWWRRCGYDTDGTYLGWPPEQDEEFVRRSNEVYLPIQESQ